MGCWAPFWLVVANFGGLPPFFTLILSIEKINNFYDPKNGIWDAFWSIFGPFDPLKMWFSCGKVVIFENFKFFLYDKILERFSLHFGPSWGSFWAPLGGPWGRLGGTWGH